MKVVCIDNSIYKSLQVGEVYDGELVFAYKKVAKTTSSDNLSNLDWSQNFLHLEGHPMELYDCRCFVTLENWRQNQISKLI